MESNARSASVTLNLSEMEVSSSISMSKVDGLNLIIHNLEKNIEDARTSARKLIKVQADKQKDVNDSTAKKIKGIVRDLDSIKNDVTEIASWVQSHSEDSPDEKSTLYFGDFKMTSSKHFSKFGIWLWKKLLGVTIINHDAAPKYWGEISEEES